MLLLEVVTTLSVIGLFASIHDRQWAALIAGCLFILVPIILTIWECRRRKSKLLFFALAQFWLLFALPIFILRIANWGIPFSGLKLGPVTGPQLHQYSTYSYLLILAVSLILAIRFQKVQEK